MKNRILYILLLTLSTNILSQEYYAFPDSLTIWSVNTDKYTVNGDTIINDQAYKKYYYSSGDSVFSYKNAAYFAAVREDNQKRIWRIERDAFEEKLLYDFSKSIGDTIVVHPMSANYFGRDSYHVTIVRVDSIIVHNSYRKRYTIGNVKGQTFVPKYWIEGIGSTRGLIDSGISQQLRGNIGYPELLCFTTEQYTYHVSSNKDCFRPITLPRRAENFIIKKELDELLSLIE
ncbi:MAG TPA: hypothetical protein DDX98_11995 [Bacteroidales bacterium]|jgi:hypothetical protein|nr:hypothetical protein [Bacteroidales bacterium]